MSEITDQAKRVAVVTGSGDIGLAIANSLATMGMGVVVFGRDQEKTVRRLAKLNPSITSRLSALGV
ncbi:MAG: hypothetical protein LBU38_02870 [Propionibacteriaceae bacterium]|jgi:NAD(P)-dependent dehydrogenase (short-subunit alcohol dehydrogenase family)|nr:hypothetical protein [Propionibacteriaceae bacterium]